MSGVVRQFHATPRETVAFALDGARDHGLTLVVERFWLFALPYLLVMAPVRGLLVLVDWRQLSR